MDPSPLSVREFGFIERCGGGIVMGYWALVKDKFYFGLLLMGFAMVLSTAGNQQPPILYTRFSNSLNIFSDAPAMTQMKGMTVLVKGSAFSGI